jgi:DNA-binding MarR family transcriptional regulator
MTPDLQALATLDRVIHEPARLMIMTVLYAVKEADFLYLQRECGLTQGNLSSHLGKLEDAQYVRIEKMFKGKYPLTVCSLTLKGREAFAEYVKKIRVVSAPPSNEKSIKSKAVKGSGTSLQAEL